MAAAKYANGPLREWSRMNDDDPVMLPRRADTPGRETI
jgi:hypothetical protein